MQEAASAQRGDEQPPATTAAAVAVLGMHKALARTLIAQTLPAPEPALRSRIDILVDIGSRAQTVCGGRRDVCLQHEWGAVLAVGLKLVGTNMHRSASAASCLPARLRQALHNHMLSCDAAGAWLA
jgi:hypothetical protein